MSGFPGADIRPSGAYRALGGLRLSRISLTARISVLFAVIAMAALFSVGMSLYDAARAGLAKRADYQLIARVEHMRSLLHDLYTVKQIEARPALFETMLGDEQDVIVFRHDAMTPFINVNPEKIALPDIKPVSATQPLRLSSLHKMTRADGLRMRWIAAEAQIGDHGETVEIIAAHVMTQEAHVLAAYRARIMWTEAIAVLITALLSFWALRAGLRPLRAMAEQTAQVTPEKLSLRLNDEHSPAELRQLARSFNAMLDRLSTGYQGLMQFSADLAHELRTPIGALIGQTQVTLARSRSTVEYRQLLESNLEELERLSRISENILFLARADHENLPVERVTLGLHHELETICTYFEGLADERGLQFTLQAEGDFSANGIMSRRAISNVVVNAVRYALPNTMIEVSGKRHENGAEIVIGNHALPIPAHELSRLFDRFYRGDASRSAFTESSGLGLAIVQAIMGLHGGRAEIACSDQGWVQVSLCFPDA